MFVALLSGMFVGMYTINSLTPYPIPTKFGILTNQNTEKNVGYKRILIFASIDVFPLILVSPITTNMHHLLLGIGGVFFGGSSFYVRCYGSGPTRGNGFFSWVRCQATARKQQSGGVFRGVRSEDLL
jgi:hypothetical protein